MNVGEVRFLRLDGIQRGEEDHAAVQRLGNEGQAVLQAAIVAAAVAAGGKAEGLPGGRIEAILFVHAVQVCNQKERAVPGGLQLAHGGRGRD